LFVLAFLPQFVDPARGTVTGQMLLLGLIFVVMAICSDSLYALLSGTIGHWLRGTPAFLRGQRLLAGSALVVLGISTVLFGS
jgi:threonine/homoserine/homoserine lactone efflux protein